jgi:hypothetical protein
MLLKGLSSTYKRRERPISGEVALVFKSLLF